MIGKVCASEKRDVIAGKAPGCRRERDRARGWRRGGWPLVALMCGGGLAFLLDPVSGRRRREQAEALIGRSARRRWGEARAKTLRSAGREKGVVHRPPSSTPAEPAGEAGQTHAVGSVVLGDRRVPKSKISLNAEADAVTVHDQLASTELIDPVTETVAGIPGAGKVVELLHLPGIHAPHPEERGARCAHTVA